MTKKDSTIVVIIIIVACLIFSSIAGGLVWFFREDIFGTEESPSPGPSKTPTRAPGPSPVPGGTPGPIGAPPSGTPPSGTPPSGTPGPVVPRAPPSRTPGPRGPAPDCIRASLTGDPQYPVLLNVDSCPSTATYYSTFPSWGLGPIGQYIQLNSTDIMFILLSQQNHSMLYGYLVDNSKNSRLNALPGTITTFRIGTYETLRGITSPSAVITSPSAVITTLITPGTTYTVFGVVNEGTSWYTFSTSPNGTRNMPGTSIPIQYNIVGTLLTIEWSFPGGTARRRFTVSGDGNSFDTYIDNGVADHTPQRRFTKNP